MTPEAAIYQFMNGFGVPAYAHTAVPSDAEFPYITYELVLGDWGQTEVNMPVNAWFRTEGEAAPNALVRQLSRALGNGGVQVPCDGGTIWLKKGSPWAQSVREEGDDEKIKRRYINVNVDYNTTEV